MESWKQTLAELSRDRFASLKRQAFLLCGNDGQAEDLVQDALIRAFAQPMRTPRPDAAEAYVRVIRTAPLLTGTDMSADPADQVLTRDVLLTAMNDLSPRQRACVVLRFYQDLPVAQVASALGIGEGTVKRYLSEAMTRLAARLSPAESE